MRRRMALLIVCLCSPALVGVSQGLGISHRGVPALIKVSKDREPASGMFLVAQRGLRDPYFGRTVILLLHHSDIGTQGLIINRQFGLKLSEAVEGIDKAEASKHNVFFGGPLGTHRLFMLIRDGDVADQSQRITGNIYFSANQHVLEHLLERKTPNSELRLFLGYSSWSAGQLAGELMRDSWHLTEGDSEAVFDAASNGLWEQLIETLEPAGIEVKRKDETPLRAGSMPQPFNLGLVAGAW